MWWWGSWAYYMKLLESEKNKIPHFNWLSLTASKNVFVNFYTHFDKPDSPCCSPKIQLPTVMNLLYVGCHIVLWSTVLCNVWIYIKNFICFGETAWYVFQFICSAAFLWQTLSDNRGRNHFTHAHRNRGKLTVGVNLLTGQLCFSHVFVKSELIPVYFPNFSARVNCWE